MVIFYHIDLTIEIRRILRRILGGHMISLISHVKLSLDTQEYIVVRKSKDLLISSRWSITHQPMSGPPPPSLTPETKNIKKILQVANNLIHLLTGEVSGELRDVIQDHRWLG